MFEKDPNGLDKFCGKPMKYIHEYTFADFHSSKKIDKKLEPLQCACTDSD
jgi:hypothetical protein